MAFIPPPDKPGTYDVPVDYGTYPTQPPQLPPYRDETKDMVERFGGVIRELTEPQEVVERFYLKLRGKMRDDKGKVVDDPEGKRMCNDRIAANLKTMLDSLSNQNQIFSNYKDQRADNILRGLNYECCRYLMFASDECPLQYRGQISFEMMAIASATLFRSVDAATMRWSKGVLSETSNFQPMGQQPQQNKGFINRMMSWKKP